MQTTSFTVGPLRGMDQRWKPSADTGARVRDLTWDGRDGWKTAGGFRRIVLGQGSPPTNPYSGKGAITSLHFFTQHNGGRAWLVYENSLGEMYAFNGSNRASNYRQALTFAFTKSGFDNCEQTSSWSAMREAIKDRLAADHRGHLPSKHALTDNLPSQIVSQIR